MYYLKINEIRFRLVQLLHRNENTGLFLQESYNRDLCWDRQHVGEVKVYFLDLGIFTIHLRIPVSVSITVVTQILRLNDGRSNHELDGVVRQIIVPRPSRTDLD